MSLQPIPVPVLLVQPAVTTFRAPDEMTCNEPIGSAPDETACNKPIGSHSTQKDGEVATEEVGNDPEKVLSSEDEFPDGGPRAWAVVLGAVFCTLTTFGFVNAWGVRGSVLPCQGEFDFNSTDLPSLLSGGITTLDLPINNSMDWLDTSKYLSLPKSLPLITLIQYALVLLPGLPVGRLFDKGYLKFPLFCASVTLVAATFVTAECKEYWQFLLVQGFIIGLACGVIFGPVLGVVATYFYRRRNLAFGIVAAGASIGGTIFPLIASSLLPRAGFKWTMRILALILLAFMVMANLLLDRRLPPRKLHSKIVDLTYLRAPPFTVFISACFIGFLGLYTVLIYIGTAAQSYGISAGEAYTLVSIANAASIVGRLSTGYLADKYGPLNIMGSSTIVTAVMTYAWPYARTYRALIPIAVLYGISSGAFISLLTAPLLSLGKPNEIGERSGMLFTIVAFGAMCGPPISGAIRKATGGWEIVGGYAGSIIMVSVILIAVTKWLAFGTLFKGMV